MTFLMSGFDLIAILIPVVIMLIFIAILAFEIWLFIDTINNPTISTNQRIAWLLGMILFHPIIAIIYYFTVRKPRY